MRALRIALLGDAVPGYAKHTALAPALDAAAEGLGIAVEAGWVPSARLAADPGPVLEVFDGVVATPQSSEYCEDVDALLRGLTFVRESGLCCLATCGGAQYALREYARALSGEAALAGLLHQAHCELPGDDGYRVSGLRSVRLEPGTRAAGAYRRLEAREPFACSYTLNTSAESALKTGAITLAGATPDIGPTVFEWQEHPFYVATLFLPQWSPEQPHALFGALLSAARARGR